MGKIKDRDLKKIKKIADEMNSLILRVREYVPDATIYLQDESFSFHYDYEDKNNNDGPKCKSEGHGRVRYLDCGGGFNRVEFVD